MGKLKLFLSLLMLMAFSLGNVWATLPASPTWEAQALADIADGSTIIIISNSSSATNVALPAAGAGTSNPPKKVCTVTTNAGVTTITPPSGTTLQDLAWTVSKQASSWKFYVEGSSTNCLYLTGTSSNTALRVGNGSSNNEFVMGDAGKLLKVTTGSRFVGPNDNNGSDWRTYNTENATNYKGAQLTFYVLRAAKPSVSVEPTTLAFGEQKQHYAVEAKTFTLTADNLTAGLALTATDGYTVSPATLTAEEAMADGGATITVTPATPTAAGENNGTVTISGDDLEEDVTVDLTMTVVGTFLVQVAVNDAEMGTATINGGASVYTDGELTLNLVAEAKPGYEFVSWTASSDDLEADDPAKASTTATALAAGTLTANFQVSATPVIALSEETLEFAAVAKGADIPAAQTFTITGANLTGDLALAWDAEGDDAFTYEITAGSLTATDGAVSATVAVTPKSTATAGSFANTLTISGGGAAAQEVLVGFEVLETYTATWYVNGAEAKTQTAVAGTALSFPADPEATGDCAELFFQGWAEAAIATKQDAAPTYTSKTEMPEADVNFYAVFATKGVEEVEGDPEWVATAYADLATNDVVVITSKVGEKVYALSNNNGTGSAPAATEVAVANSKLSAAPATTLQWDVTKDDDNATFYVHGSTTSWLYATNANNGVRVGENSSNAFSIKDDYLYHNGQSRYLGVYNSADWRCYSTINTNISGQTLAFYKKTAGTKEVEVYTDFLTTCPSCASVALTKGATENGAFTLKVNGVETASVKTCEGATVDVEFAPAEGYTLDAFTVSGVENATYADGQITIPVDATGTLVATATFKAINYTVTMEQTGDAEATLSANQTEKHYGETIAVSANEPEGFVFLGWKATPSVEFVDKYAKSTTFILPANDVTVTAEFAKVISVAEALEATDGDKFCVLGIVSRITSIAGTFTTARYYITDDGSENNELYAYNAKYINGADFTSEDQLHVGDKVVVYGEYTIYNDVKELKANNYIVNRETLKTIEITGEPAELYWAGDNFDLNGFGAKAVYSEGYELALQTELEADPVALTAETASVAVSATWNGVKGTRNIDVNVKTIANTKETAYTATEAVALIEAGNGLNTPVYVKGRITYNGIIELYNGTLNVWVLDPENEDFETNSLQFFHMTNISGENFESVNDLTEGDNLVAYGKLYKYINANEKVVYEFNGCELIEREKAVVESLVITGDATQKAYEAGDNFNFNGLAVTAQYQTGYSTAVTEKVEWSATAIDANTTMVTATASFEGKSANKEVNGITINTHAVTIETPENGTLVVKNGEEAIASGDAFAKGTVLTVEATPASEDYKAGVVTVTGATLEGNTITVGTTDFTVSVVFAEKAEAGIEWSTTYGEIQVQGTEIVNSDLPSLTNPYELTITYSSEDTDVAEIDPATGVITPKAEGYTTISATFAGNEDYKAAQVSFNLNVEVVAQPEFYVIGSFNDWNEFVPVYDWYYEFENLAAGDHQLKVTTAPNWDDQSQIYGYDALTVKHAGLSKNNDNGNICFTISNESSIVIVDFEKDEDGVKTFMVTGGYVKPTFTVVGVEALVGYNWGDGLNAYENEMAEDLPSENYELVKEDVMLAAGDYEYQVAMNHDWRYGASNSKLTITESGRYNVTFTYVPSTGATSAEARLIEPIVILPTMKIAGDWDVDSENTSKWNENELIVAGDEKTATYTAKDLVKNTWYHFWIIKNGVYMSGNKGFDRENLSADLTTYYTGTGAYAMYFQADQDGDYTFTWTYKTNVITMTFPYKEATALDNTEAGETAVKVMQNGQLLIIKNGKTYNAQGAVVK